MKKLLSTYVLIPIESSVKTKSNNNLIAVDPGTLDLLRFEQVVVEDDCNPLDIYRIIKQLKNESSAHTWKKIYDINEVNADKKLVEFEETRRPTKFFFYYGIGSNGSRTLIGTGTVAHKISNKFAFEGFPVIARCLIAPQFRNHRLYEPILKHRYKYCLDYFGDSLKGIHLGSQSPRIFSVIQKNVFPIPFVYIGNESLDVGDHSELVRDYLCLQDIFKLKVNQEIGNYSSQLKSSALKKIIEDLFENKFTSSSYFKLMQVLNNEALDTKKLKWFLPSLLEIVSLFEAIGVISSNEDEKTTQLPTHIRKPA